MLLTTPWSRSALINLTRSHDWAISGVGGTDKAQAWRRERSAKYELLSGGNSWGSKSWVLHSYLNQRDGHQMSYRTFGLVERARSQPLKPIKVKVVEGATERLGRVKEPDFNRLCRRQHFWDKPVRSATEHMNCVSKEDPVCRSAKTEKLFC